jgi:LuxR family transcriptional regulator, maltose regulon positive regulatory protein
MFSYCRTAYAGVLMHRGAWAEAEQELLASVTELEATKPPMAAEGVCGLAELRRRQGRLAEAAAMYDRAERPPLAMVTGPVVLLGRAALALDQGEPERAVDLAERYLRRVAPGDRAERVGGLELLARALAASGAVERAQPVLDELNTAVTALGVDVLQACASLALGVVRLAAGDLGTARRSLEDAVDGFAKHGLPYESARALLALAEALVCLERHAEARREARTAAATFGRLGAAHDARRAEALLRAFPDAAPGAAGAAGLTSREIEALRLVAEGLSNEQIAQRLVLSLRTVERHLSNIYVKLGVSGRVARTAAASYAHTHGLTSPR